MTPKVHIRSESRFNILFSQCQSGGKTSSTATSTDWKKMSSIFQDAKDGTLMQLLPL